MARAAKSSPDPISRADISCAPQIPPYDYDECVFHSSSKLQDLEAQRRELHGKLETLRKCQRKESQDTQAEFKIRSQSARRGKEETTRSTTSSNGGLEIEYDEDKDVASSTDEESCSRKSDPKPTSKPCHSCESLQAEKMSNESEFMKMKLNIKFLHKV